MGSETKKIDDEYLNGINALKLLNRRSISRIRNSLNNLELSTITKTEFINQCRGIYAESRIEYFNVSLEGFETEDMLELINFSNNDADVEPSSKMLQNMSIRGRIKRIMNCSSIKIAVERRISKLLLLKEKLLNMNKSKSFAVFAVTSKQHIAFVLVDTWQLVKNVAYHMRLKILQGMKMIL